MYLVVGLGNPGPEYENTRHNVGFMVVKEFISLIAMREPTFKRKCKALVYEANFYNKKIIIAQPQTFMNLSGDAVQALLSWYKIGPGHLIVAYDDVDLEVGQLRIRDKGSSGGHHGIESIIKHIGTSEFIRVRVGIGRDSFTQDVSNYVLSRIPSEEKDKINEAVRLAAIKIREILEKGVASMSLQPSK